MMNTLKTTLLLGMLTILFIWIGYALGGESGMTIALMFALVMNAFSYWFSDKIVLKMYRATEVMIVASIAAMMIQMAVSRSREYAADATGAKIAGNPQHLANALRKLHSASGQIPLDAQPATAHMFIVNPLTGGKMAKLFRGLMVNIYDILSPVFLWQKNVVFHLK